MIKDSLKTIALSLIVLSLVGVAYAWTEPTVSPPNQDPTISKPLTESKTGQIKAGGFWIGSDATAVANNGGKGLIVENGNVGIGTTSPASKFHIYQQGGNYLRMEDPGSSASQSNGIWDILVSNGPLADNSGDLALTKTTGQNAVMTLKADGNVGIGTTSPRGRLEIKLNGAAVYWDGVVGNYGADTYSDIGWENWQDWQANERDTCDSNSFAEYTCNVNESRSCLDYRGASYYYQNRVSAMARNVVCKKETKMQMTTVDLIE